MSIWDKPMSECTSKELKDSFYWFHEGEGGKGMKDLINYDKVCDELEERGWTYCKNCNDYFLENERCECEEG